MFAKLLTYSEMPDKSAKSITVGEVDIAVFKVDGKVYAVKNICPHQHFAHLHEGEILDGAVSCPMHG